MRIRLRKLNKKGAFIKVTRQLCKMCVWKRKYSTSTLKYCSNVKLCWRGCTGLLCCFAASGSGTCCCLGTNEFQVTSWALVNFYCRLSLRRHATVNRNRHQVQRFCQKKFLIERRFPNRLHWNAEADESSKTPPKQVKGTEIKYLLNSCLKSELCQISVLLVARTVGVPAWLVHPTSIRCWITCLCVGSWCIDL